MTKKIILVSIFLILFAACGQNARTTELEAQLKTAEDKISNLESQIKQAKEERLSLEEQYGPSAEIITELQAELEKYKLQIESFETGDGFKYSDTIPMKLKVLRKELGTDLYPYFIIATDLDEDHNSPILLTVEKKALYDSIKEGDVKTFKVGIIHYIQREFDKARFSFSLYGVE